MSKHDKKKDPRYATYVALHDEWRARRGKPPSRTFEEERNLRMALYAVIVSLRVQCRIKHTMETQGISGYGCWYSIVAEDVVKSCIKSRNAKDFPDIHYEIEYR